jgi:digeranylgeranylglycerophospholipid reductase
VTSLLIKKGSIRGFAVEQRQKTTKLAANVVIDAEGVSSNLLRGAGLPSLNRHTMVSGVQAEVDRIEGADASTVEVFLSNQFASGFFAWIVPRRDGTAKIGLGTAKGSPRRCLHQFIHHHPIAHQRLKQGHITKVTYHPISLGGPISKTFHDGLLVVGDAASQVKPTTGGGIIMGLTCAELAGEIAAQAVHRNDTSASFLSKYERNWKKKIGFDMTVMRQLRRILNRLTDKQLDKLIAFCHRINVGEILGEVRDVDFQGTSLIRLPRNHRLLAMALYLLSSHFIEAF